MQKITKEETQCPPPASICSFLGEWIHRSMRACTYACTTLPFCQGGLRSQILPSKSLHLRRKGVLSLYFNKGTAVGHAVCMSECYSFEEALEQCWNLHWCVLPNARDTVSLMRNHVPLISLLQPNLSLLSFECFPNTFLFLRGPSKAEHREPSASSLPGRNELLQSLQLIPSHFSPNLGFGI